MKYTHFEYPFLFNEQLLTQGTLDILGFTECWSSCGDYGIRSLLLNGKQYTITISDELIGSTCKYGEKGYVAKMVMSSGGRALYFLHDLYDDVFETLGVTAANELQSLCDKHGMGIPMQSYIRFRELYIDDMYYNEFIKDKDEKHTI